MLARTVQDLHPVRALFASQQGTAVYQNDGVEFVVTLPESWHLIAGEGEDWRVIGGRVTFRSASPDGLPDSILCVADCRTQGRDAIDLAMDLRLVARTTYPDFMFRCFYLDHDSQSAGFRYDLTVDGFPFRGHAFIRVMGMRAYHVTLHHKAGFLSDEEVLEIAQEFARHDPTVASDKTGQFE